MPPTQSAAGKARKVRDVDYFQQQLEQLNELGEGNTIEFEADLKIFTTLQSEFVTLDKELKGFFSQIQQENPGPFGKATVFMFKNTCGGEKNVWSFQREVAHRLEFLRMAQDSASNRMLFTEGCKAQPFDENLDRLMDFVILTGNGEQSLRGVSTEDLKLRCKKDKWETNFFNPDEIFDYVCNHGGDNRRTQWKPSVDNASDRPNPQAGRSKYCSNGIKPDDRGTSAFGRYDKHLSEFVPWEKVDSRAVRPYRACVKTLVNHEMLSYERTLLRDKLGNAVAKRKRPTDRDRALCANPPHPRASSFIASQRANNHASVHQRALDTVPDAQGHAKCNRYFAQNIRRFQQEWETLVCLGQSSRFPRCLNMIWTLTRMLKDSACMVFSMPGAVYRPVTDQHRRLDDNVSYADPELTKLILDHSVTDADFLEHRTFNGAVCKVFQNEQMKREGLVYTMKPFAFIFDCETAMLRLTSARNLYNVDVGLFYSLRNILAQIARGCGLASAEEMVRRMDDPVDPFFGDQPLAPLMKFELEINVESLGVKWIHRRATLQELNDEGFPYKTDIFASKQIEDGPLVLHDGTTFYAKYPERDFLRLEPDGGMIVLDWVGEEEPESEN